MVDGLVVVGVRARLEQQRRHARLVGDARRAVERAERAELRVLPARVGVGAGVEQRPRAREQPVGALAAEEGGVAWRRAAAASRARPPGRVAAAGSRASAARTRSASPSTSAASNPSRPRSGSSASSASAWSRRPSVASCTSRRARSSRATDSASTRRTSRGQLASPSSRAIASCASASLSASPPPARPSRGASPRAARARDRSVLRPSPITSVSPAVRSGGQRSIGTRRSHAIEVGLGPCPRTRVRPRARRGRYPAARGPASGGESKGRIAGDDACAFGRRRR